MDIKELQIAVEENKQNHPWEYARYKVVFSIIDSYIKKIASPTSVIDVGCGDIFFLNNFHRKYPQFRPIAVDSAFNDKLIDYIIAHNKIAVTFYNDIDKVTCDDKANIIFLMDVIEHIEHEKEFLKTLSRMKYVDDNTLFLITVPAFNNLFCAHDRWLGHYRRYSQKNLRSVIEEADFQYIEGGSFFLVLLFPRLLQKIFELISKKDNDKETGVGNWTGGKLTSFLFEKILLCDFYFCRIFHRIGIKIPGLSTYVLCKRNINK